MRGTNKKAVSLKLPAEWVDVLRRTADEQGVDLTAVVCSIVSESIPRLERWLREREREKARGGDDGH